MRTKLTLCAIFALSALLGGCDDTRTIDFCATLCECNADNLGGIDACTNQCTQSIDALESSNAGAPIVTDECFACATNTTCEIALVTCSSECEILLQALQNPPDPQPGDPIDPPTN